MLPSNLPFSTVPHDELTDRMSAAIYSALSAMELPLPWSTSMMSLYIEVTVYRLHRPTADDTVTVRIKFTVDEHKLYASIHIARTFGKGGKGSETYTTVPAREKKLRDTIDWLNSRRITQETADKINWLLDRANDEYLKSE